MANKFKIEIICDEYYVADSLFNLSSLVESGDLLDKMTDDYMVDGALEVNGDHYTAYILFNENK